MGQILAERARAPGGEGDIQAAGTVPAAAGGTCAIVAGMAAGQGGSISLAELSSGLSERGMAFLLLLFAAPSALPVAIPGVSAVIAMPLLLVAAHLVLGRSSPALPGCLARRAIPRDRLTAIVERIGPAIHRIERRLRPRWVWLTHSAARRLVGLLVLVLALAIAVPFPLSNSLPGLAICLIALGLLERDGLAVAAGCLLGLVAVAILASLVLGAAHLPELLVAAVPG